MSGEATPTPAASEGDQTVVETPAPGAPADGGNGGTDSTVTVESLTAEREKLAATVRELQSVKDRQAAELAKLKAPAPDTAAAPTAAAPLDPRAFYAEVSKLGALDRTAETLKAAGTYKYADEALFAKATEFDSPEAFEAAVKASHDRVASLVEASVTETVQAKLTEAGKKYGVDLVAPAAAPETPAGEPTLEQWSAMTMDEQDAWEAKSPGITDRIVRSAFNAGG